MKLISTSLIFAQRDNSAYESGRKVGQIVGYIIVAVVVIWILRKFLNR